MTKKIDVLGKNGEKVKSIDLPKSPFSSKVNAQVVSQYMRVYTTNQTQGTSKTKGISEVSGGGRKPWRQKGTGRARVGSIRSPIWVGGGHIHAKTPHTRRLKMNRKMRLKALASVFADKINSKSIVIVDKLEINGYKTKEFVNLIKSLGLKGSTLFIIGEKGEKNMDYILKSGANIDNIDITTVKDLNTFRVLVKDAVVIEEGALNDLESVFKI